MSIKSLFPKAALIAAPLALLGGMSAYALDSHDERDMRETKAPPAKIIGEAKSCINLRSIRQSKVHDDYTIDFKMRNGDIYRNELPRRCSGLGFEESFSYKTSLGQLCSTDIIDVISNTGGRIETRGSCGLGKFQKVEMIEAVEPDRSIDIMDGPPANTQ